MPVFSINNGQSTSAEAADHSEQLPTSDTPVFTIHNNEPDSQTSAASAMSTFEQPSTINEKLTSNSVTLDSSIQSNAAKPQIDVQGTVPASSAPVKVASQQSSNSGMSSFAAVESEVVEQLRKANALPSMEEPTTAVDSSATASATVSGAFTPLQSASPQLQRTASSDSNAELKVSPEETGEGSSSATLPFSESPAFPLHFAESEASDAFKTSDETSQSELVTETNSNEEEDKHSASAVSTGTSFDFDEPLENETSGTAPVFPTINGAGNNQSSVTDKETIPTREEVRAAENSTATAATNSQASTTPQPPRPKSVEKVQALIVNSNEVAEHKEKQKAQWQGRPQKRETRKNKRKTKPTKNSSVYKKSFLALLGFGGKDDQD